MSKIDRKGWKKITFGEVCSNVNATVRNPEQAGIERYIGLEHIEPGSLHIKSWGNVADGTTFTKGFKPGQVLFGKRRAYQKKAALATFAGLCSGDILVLEPNEKLIDKNLFPFLVASDGFFDYAVQTSAGSLSPRTKFQDLANYEFLLPPKDQQARIAELLWAADDVVQKYCHLVSSLNACSNIKEFKVFQELKFRDNVKKETIGSRLKLINGSAFKPEDWDKTGIPIIRIQNLNGSDDYNYFSAEIHSKVVVQTGSLLFAWSGNRGTSFGPYIWSGDQGVLNQHIFKIEFAANEIDQQFLYYYLRYLTTEIESQAHGSAALVHITKGALEKFPLYLPDINEQKYISRLLDDIANSVKYANYTLSVEVEIQKQLINQVFG